MSGSLGAPAPAGNLQVTIRSLDSSKLLLSTIPTAAGSGSITLTVHAGSSSIPGFYVQALAGTGTVDFETTAPGYAPDTSTVTLNPSGFVLNANNFSTNTFAANTTIRVDAALLNPIEPQVGIEPGPARRFERQRHGDELEHECRHDYAAVRRRSPAATRSRT